MKASDQSIDLVAAPHPKSKAVVDFADGIAQLHHNVKQRLKQANVRYKARADRRRSEIT